MSKKNKPTEDYLGREFVITRQFAAPRERVWRAWTDPAQLAQWWGPRGFTNPVCEWDARPGQTIHVVMRAPNGADHPMGGEFREIAAPERLVFTSGALNEKGKLLFEFLHTVTFVERRGQTLLTIRSQVMKTTAEANKYIGGFEAGMTQSLERLDELLAVKNERVVVERTFAAPVAKVWAALTNKEAMQQWSFDIKEFKPVVGFAFEMDVEHEGARFLHRCKITKVIPEKKLAYTWRYEGHPGDSLVTIELGAVGQKTKVRLTHAGIETFPKTPSFARENFVKGWTAIIGENLRKFVEITAEADTADREIVITRVVDAPCELVWSAWTDPKQIVEWWGPNGFATTIEKMDVRPGGVWKYIMHGPDGTDYPNQSAFTDVVKPERIVFSHGGGKKGAKVVNFEMRWIFEKQGKKTKATIRQVYPTTADRDYVAREYGTVEGGRQTLARLALHLAKITSKSA